MSRTKEQNEKMRLITKEKILSAAIYLFSEKGFTATNIMEIAKRAEISVGLIYNHYRTKIGIYEGLVQEAIKYLTEEREMLFFDASPLEIITRFTDDITNEMARNDEFSRYMLILFQPLIAQKTFEWLNDFYSYSTKFLEDFARLIESGQQKGIFKAGDPQAMTQFYIASMHGLCSLQLSLKEKFRAPTTEMMISFLIK